MYEYKEYIEKHYEDVKKEGKFFYFEFDDCNEINCTCNATDFPYASRRECHEACCRCIIISDKKSVRDIEESDDAEWDEKKRNFYEQFVLDPRNPTITYSAWVDFNFDEYDITNLQGFLALAEAIVEGYAQDYHLEFNECST